MSPHRLVLDKVSSCLAGITEQEEGSFARMLGPYPIVPIPMQIIPLLYTSVLIGSLLAFVLTRNGSQP